MGIFDILRKKQIVDFDKQLREKLAKIGRITEGTIVERTTEEAGEVVFYVYRVQGADFESSAVLSETQLAEPIKYAPGAKVGIRYDPRQHGNSILI